MRVDYDVTHYLFATLTLAYILILCRTLDQMLEDVNSDRTVRRQIAGEVEIDGWNFVDKERNNFELPEIDPTMKFLIFNVRAPQLPLAIFKRIVTVELLQNVWEGHKLADNSVWVYKTHPAVKTINGDKFSLALIYKFLAIKMRIQALRNPTNGGSTPLKTSLLEAKSHFGQNGARETPSLDILVRLNAHYLITDDFFEELSRNFLGIVSRLGEWVAGDEKLLHFTGNSGDIRIILHKPDRIGLWFYQLCAPLCTGRPYILYARMHRSDPSRGQSIKTREIVNDWADIVVRKDNPELRNPATILVMDSYYLTAAGRDDLLAKDVKFVAAVQAARFKTLHSQLDHKVERPGQWEGIFKSETNELFVLHHDKALKGSGNKRKLCLTNALTLEHRRPRLKEIIPGYTAYGQMFNVCDHFNKNLHNRMWPHKHGGRDCEGDPGHQNNFAWSCILQNVFNAYVAINGENHDDYSFRDFYVELADALYNEAVVNL